MKQNDDVPFTIAIIGLGLMGGSMAYALKGFEEAKIVGADMDADARTMAVQGGAVTFASAAPADAIRGADLIILCVYPDLAVEIVENNTACFKAGAVVTDICGVKESITPRLRELLPKSVDYVPCHPMAGKEVGGFANADGALFRGTGFIITPLESSRQESVGLIHRMAEHIGAGHITCCSPSEHDKMIAYTSHLTHISAAALCLEKRDVERAFIGGSFRDCTRVANINPELWSALFLENRESVLDEIKRFERSVGMFKDAIERSDGDALRALLGEAGKNKRRLL